MDHYFGNKKNVNVENIFEAVDLHAFVTQIDLTFFT